MPMVMIGIEQMLYIYKNMLDKRMYDVFIYVIK